MKNHQSSSKLPNNKIIFDKACDLMEEARLLPNSNKNKVLMIAIYKKGENAEARTLFNGFTLDEVDVLLREIYGKVYALRKSKDPKMQEINQKLEDKKNNV